MPNSAHLPPAIAKRSIVLVGMMGAGKSTVGRRLAKRMARPFADADEEIERAAGMTIAEIFTRYGEQHFRDGERRVISRLLGGPPMVVATGGGAMAQPETRAIILESGLAVWLDVSLDILVERVSRRNTRPLLHNRNPRTVLSELLDQRAPAYATAHIRVRSDQTPHAHTVDAVIEALGDYGAQL